MKQLYSNKDLLKKKKNQQRKLSSVLCDDLEGWDGGGREAQEGGDICIHIADSLCCTAETNNIVKQLYSIKIK